MTRLLLSWIIKLHEVQNFIVDFIRATIGLEVVQSIFVFLRQREGLHVMRHSIAIGFLFSLLR